MSLEFEYRRLAAACLDLAKRAAHADKTRLLLIAEAWLNLAGRVARKLCQPPKRRFGGASFGHERLSQQRRSANVTAPLVLAGF
jgi:hypothetical protein